MSKAIPPSASEPAFPRGRIVTIDVLRGLAIFWVMLFHLGADMGIAPASQLYPAVRDHLAAGEPVAALRAFGQLICILGYQGVPVFMMLSGLSLTLTASRHRNEGALASYIARARKLVVPFWVALCLTLTTVASIALIEMLLHGGSYHAHWNAVTLQKIVPVGITLDDVFHTVTVFTWLLREKDTTFSVNSLWFVQMLLLYYAIFPVALRLLSRVGPWWFAALGLLVTLAARALLIFAGPAWLEPVYIYRSLFSVGVFRGSEFFLGMSLGYLLLHQREAVADWVRSPFDIAGLAVLALLVQLAAVVLGPKSDILTVIEDPLIQIALLLLILPLVFKTPGRIELSRPVTAIAFIGAISYGALIINDQMRYVASLLRQEEIPNALWWFFLVAIYFPLGTLLAYPFSKALGLLPRPTASHIAAPETEPSPPLELQPAGGG